MNRHTAEKRSLPLYVCVLWCLLIGVVVKVVVDIKAEMKIVDSIGRIDVIREMVTDDIHFRMPYLPPNYEALTYLGGNWWGYKLANDCFIYFSGGRASVLANRRCDSQHHPPVDQPQ